MRRGQKEEDGWENSSSSSNNESDRSNTAATAAAAATATATAATAGASYPSASLDDFSALKCFYNPEEAADSRVTRGYFTSLIKLKSIALETVMPDIKQMTSSSSSASGSSSKTGTKLVVQQADGKKAKDVAAPAGPGAAPVNPGAAPVGPGAAPVGPGAATAPAAVHISNKYTTLEHLIPPVAVLITVGRRIVYKSVAIHFHNDVSREIDKRTAAAAAAAVTVSKGPGRRGTVLEDLQQYPELEGGKLVQAGTVEEDLVKARIMLSKRKSATQIITRGREDTQQQQQQQQQKQKQHRDGTRETVDSSVLYYKKEDDEEVDHISSLSSSAAIESCCWTAEFDLNHPRSIIGIHLICIDKTASSSSAAASSAASSAAHVTEEILASRFMLAQEFASRYYNHHKSTTKNKQKDKNNNSVVLQFSFETPLSNIAVDTSSARTGPDNMRSTSAAPAAGGTGTQSVLAKLKRSRPSRVFLQLKVKSTYSSVLRSFPAFAIGDEHSEQAFLNRTVTDSATPRFLTIELASPFVRELEGGKRKTFYLGTDRCGGSGAADSSGGLGGGISTTVEHLKLFSDILLFWFRHISSLVQVLLFNTKIEALYLSSSSPLSSLSSLYTSLLFAVYLSVIILSPLLRFPMLFLMIPLFLLITRKMEDTVTPEMEKVYLTAQFAAAAPLPSGFQKAAAEVKKEATHSSAQTAKQTATEAAAAAPSSNEPEKEQKQQEQQQELNQQEDQQDKQQEQQDQQQKQQDQQQQPAKPAATVVLMQTLIQSAVPEELETLNRIVSPLLRQLLPASVFLHCCLLWNPDPFTHSRKMADYVSGLTASKQVYPDDSSHSVDDDDNDRSDGGRGRDGGIVGSREQQVQRDQKQSNRYSVSDCWTSRPRTLFYHMFLFSVVGYLFKIAKIGSRSSTSSRSRRNSLVPMDSIASFTFFVFSLLSVLSLVFPRIVLNSLLLCSCLSFSYLLLRLNPVFAFVERFVRCVYCWSFYRISK